MRLCPRIRINRSSVRRIATSLCLPNRAMMYSVLDFENSIVEYREMLIVRTWITRYHVCSYKPEILARIE